MLVKQDYQLSALLWIYDGPSAWHFFTLPKKESAEIKKNFQDFKRGWGSLPVKVAIGESIWKTSIFPDTKREGYLLPVKGQVRKAENLQAGKKYKFNITILASEII